MYAVWQLFTDTIEDSLPHCRAELEDLGRCQGRPAALQVLYVTLSTKR
jgi:hypothetical protein